MLELIVIWQLPQVKHVHDTPLIRVGDMWGQLVDWARKNMLKPKLNLANREDVTIPRSVSTADEAIALIREYHAKWRQCRSQ